ncbi:MAG: hypothetical protein A3G87_00780 [Omnitrophica bacterium RIFCSPLOWO2_12_FULL_50_11]|nr:MAG: hypothetical protein A3G87_00780 [Omnitrophica bacterium RIFCSPLOWO2_12_FULL_50_11]
MLSSIKRTWNEVSVDPKTVRTFGFILSGFFLLFPLLTTLMGVVLARKPVHYWFGWPLLSAVAFFANLFLPFVMGVVYRVAMFVAYGVSWMVVRIVLGILFYLVLSPLSIAMRLAGKDLLDQKMEPARDTYWKKRPPKPPRSQYERLF